MFRVETPVLCKAVTIYKRTCVLRTSQLAISRNSSCKEGSVACHAAQVIISVHFNKRSHTELGVSE